MDNKVIVEREERGRGIGKRGEEGSEKMTEVKKVKRTYKKRIGVEKADLNKELGKYFIDVSSEIENKDLISNLLQQANNKDLGKEITFKDLVISALSKLSAKDIEKVQESSFSKMDKVLRKMKEHNSKNGTNYELGEYLTKILRIE